MVMYSVMYSLAGPPGNQGQAPSSRCCSSSFRSSRDVSSFSRFSSNRMPTLRRAWLSALASRTQGVSSSMTAFRSWFFSSGLSSAGVPFHCSNTRRIFGSELAMCRASALAYSRLNVCSVHSYGNSIKYGSAMTAYQDGLETIWTVSDWCRSVSEPPDVDSLANSNFFVCGPRIGSGNDSVTSTAPRQHGQEALLAVGQLAGRADRLVGQVAQSVGHGQPPRETAGLLGRDVERLVGRGVAQQRIGRVAGPGVGQRQSHAAGLARRRLVADLDRELQHVAFAQEARRIGLDHQVLGRHRACPAASRSAVGGRGRSPGTSTGSAPRAW